MKEEETYQFYDIIILCFLNDQLKYSSVIGMVPLFLFHNEPFGRLECFSDRQPSAQVFVKFPRTRHLQRLLPAILYR